MSDRSYISVHYDHTEPDGTLVHIESTRGNHDLRDMYASQLGKDVICDIPLGYSCYKTEEDGLHMTMIVAFRMNGNVPNFFMNFVTRQSTGAPIMIEEYIVDGKIPKLL